MGEADLLERLPRGEEASIGIVKAVITGEGDDVEPEPFHLFGHKAGRTHPGPSCFCRGVNLGTLVIMDECLKMCVGHVRVTDISPRKKPLFP
jgi:hypothetical protein